MPTRDAHSSRVGACLVTVVLALLTLGCGEETPARAIYSLAHDLEHENVSSACERLYPSAQVPPAIAAALSIPSRPASSSGFACERALAEGGELSSFELVEPRVRSAQQVTVTAESGITGAATARVAIDGADPVIVKLVEVRGRYRVVVDVGGRRLA